MKSLITLLVFICSFSVFADTTAQCAADLRGFEQLYETAILKRGPIANKDGDEIGVKVFRSKATIANPTFCTAMDQLTKGLIIAYVDSSSFIWHENHMRAKYLLVNAQTHVKNARVQLEKR